MQTFTRTLTCLLALLFTTTLAMAQTTYTTVGIIGTAAGGWTASVPMQRADATNPHLWTITQLLTQGEMKFRADNAWFVNWGGTTYPTGTGMRDGQNIVIPQTGNFTVLFDDATGAYQFAPATTTGSRPPAADAQLSLAVAPNPSREAVRVAYTLATAATVSLKVLNLLGQPVYQLSAVRQGAGQQEQFLSLQSLSTGMYIVQVQAGSRVQTARLLVE